jgi:ceroid-lipofuscinosis MFS transporter 7
MIELSHQSPKSPLQNQKSEELLFYGSTSASNVDVIEERIVTDESYHFNSVVVIALVVLIADMARGILFPSLWLYIVSLSGNRVSLGIAVASFSGGRIVSSPIAGYWSDSGGYRIVLITLSFIIMSGGIIYSTGKSLIAIYIGQFIMGFGAGSLGVTRSYVAECSNKSNRTVNMAYLTSVQYFGFTVMPFLGSIISKLGNYLDPHSNLKYVLPATSVSIMAFISIILLATVFREKRNFTELNYTKLETVEKTFADESNSTATAGASVTVAEVGIATPSINNWLAVAGCLLNVTTKGTIGVYETMGAEFVVSHFQWSLAKVGSVFAMFGMLGVGCLLCFNRLVKVFGDVELIMYGMSIMMISCMLLMSEFGTQMEWQFYLSLFLLYSVGYPVGHTAVLGMVSKLTTSGPQGTLLGWFGSAGSLARVIFPILAGVLAEQYKNDSIIFAVMALLLVVSIILVKLFKGIIESVISV